MWGLLARSLYKVSIILARSLWGISGRIPAVSCQDRLGDLYKRSLHKLSVSDLHARAKSLQDISSLYKISRKGLWLRMHSVDKKYWCFKGESEPNVCGSWKRLRESIHTLRLLTTTPAKDKGDAYSWNAHAKNGRPRSSCSVRVTKIAGHRWDHLIHDESTPGCNYYRKNTLFGELTARVNARKTVTTRLGRHSKTPARYHPETLQKPPTALNQEIAGSTETPRYDRDITKAPVRHHQSTTRHHRDTTGTLPRHYRDTTERPLNHHEEITDKTETPPRHHRRQPVTGRRPSAFRVNNPKLSLVG